MFRAGLEPPCRINLIFFKKHILCTLRPPNLESRKDYRSSQMWWLVLAISPLGRLRQEDHKFKASLDCMSSMSQKTHHDQRRTIIPSLNHKMT